MKKVLLLTTGGTIAAQMSGAGLQPQMASSGILELTQELGRRYDLTTKDIFNLDSSNIQAEEWQTIAREAFAALPFYDGIVVTHGTDTMAYTASMLSYMLEGVRKPVVLTGSQMPASHFLSDARGNLFTAFAAVESGIPGVCIAFDYKVICGCRAVKVRTLGFSAFESINAPPLALVNADGLVKQEDFRMQSRLYNCAQPRLRDQLSPDVFLLKLIPGTNPDIFDMLYRMRYRGVVLETFGTGGLHFVRRNLLPRLKTLIDNGVSVAACSQCLYEKSDFSIYEVGTRLLDCGIIPGRDMTTEALVTKMMWALGQTDDPAKVRRMFDTNYAGETA